MISTAPGITRNPIHEELDTIANWYRFGNSVGRYLPRLERHLDTYLELTFQPGQYEIITGGKGEQCVEDFSHMAQQLGLHHKTMELFDGACRRFPGSIVGFKMPVQQNRIATPSLYVRSKCAKEKVFSWLLDSGLNNHALQALSDSMLENECFYGLGFTEVNGEPFLKTYTIDRIGKGNPEQLGFVSQRIHNQTFLSARKEYLPDVPISNFDPPSGEWEKLVRFLVEEMKYRTAGHLGYIVDG